MRVVTDIGELRQFQRGAFVPTMGALHEGHLALIRRAARLTRPVVVSVFVNPTQFGPGEDFNRYPRRLDADVAASNLAGAEVVFVPRVETVYPPPPDGPIPPPPLPPVATAPRLEDARRPGHFAGVCQVVARLLDLTRPRFAVFGEKDYQQLRVIEALAEQEGDRWPELEIVPVETIRELDGLALSSRNAYLDPGQRDRAAGLHLALSEAQTIGAPPRQSEQLMRDILLTHGLEIDYAVVRRADTLMPTDSLGRPARALIAARVGEVRLIDNAPMPVVRQGNL